MSEGPLRLMIYDGTCVSRRVPFGLSTAWWAGAGLYSALGRFDASRGVKSWEQAFDWIAATEPDRPIAEVQFWGHGSWGVARVDGERLDVDSLRTGHAHHSALRALRKRMVPGEGGLFWFRTCETLGAASGQRFARSLADFLGCRVAGHTYVIHALQSGLHSHQPGAEPAWAPDEGILEGTPERPVRAHNSAPGAPHTITMLKGRIPAGW